MTRQQRGPMFRLEIEALPGNAPPGSRLKRAFKMLAWYQIKVQSVHEMPAAVAISTRAERKA